MAAARHVEFVRSEWQCLSAEEDLFSHSRQLINEGNNSSK